MIFQPQRFYSLILYIDHLSLNYDRNKWSTNKHGVISCSGYMCIVHHLGLNSVYLINDPAVTWGTQVNARKKRVEELLQSLCWELAPGPGFPGGKMVKNPPANAGEARDASLTPGLGRPPGAGNGNPLHYSCMENPMDRGAWWATAHEVTKVEHS